MKTIFKNIINNWRDIITMLGALALGYIFLDWAENAIAVSRESLFLAHFIKLGKAIMAFLFVVMLPWFVIGITFPNTVGRFLLDGFRETWNGDKVKLGDLGEETEPIIPNNIKLYISLGVYALFVLVGVLAWLGVA